MNPKETLIKAAAEKGLVAAYAGKEQVMYVNGNGELEVKSFIRVCNLKGKKTYPFAIKQGKIG